MILDVRSNNETTVDNIRIGEFFMKDNCLFICVDDGTSGCNDSVSVIEVAFGTKRSFLFNEKVSPVKLIRVEVEICND